MSALDCNTPKGREWIAHQHGIIGALSAHWGVYPITTPDTAPGDVDALYTDGASILVAAVEVKARAMSLGKLRDFGSYLVTWDKLKKGAALGGALAVPYYLAVGLVHDKRIAYWKISDERGNIIVDADVRQTRTQATCNGGDAYRVNAYLPLGSMNII